MSYRKLVTEEEIRMAQIQCDMAPMVLDPGALNAIKTYATNMSQFIKSSVQQGEDVSIAIYNICIRMLMMGAWINKNKPSKGNK